MKTLEKKFALKKQLQFEKSQEPGYEIVCLPDKSIVYFGDGVTEADYADIFAAVKMGEIDPLLSTTMLSNDSREKDFVIDFQQIISPLKEAWISQILRAHAPEEWEKGIEEWKNLFSQLNPGSDIGDDKHLIFYRKDNQKNLFNIIIGMVLFEADLKFSIKIRPGVKGGEEFGRYIQFMKDSVSIPSAETYLKIPEILKKPYTASIIEEDGMRVFSIKGKTTR